MQLPMEKECSCQGRKSAAVKGEREKLVIRRRLKKDTAFFFYKIAKIKLARKERFWARQMTKDKCLDFLK